MEDFDEEISGINLSKLFSAYGPVTQTTGGARIHPRPAPYMNDSQDIDEDIDGDENLDFSGFDEPIIVRLMSNMFN